MVQQTVAHYTNLANTLYQQNPSWNPAFTWELWNEPNYGGTFWPGNSANDYMNLAVGGVAGDTYSQGALQLIRDTANNTGGAGSNVTITGPAVSSYPGLAGDDPTAYLTTCLQRGLLNKVDGLGVHPYRGSNPETVVNDTSGLNYTSLRALMTQYGGSNGSTCPILSSEWGYMSSGSPASCANPGRLFAANVSHQL